MLLFPLLLVWSMLLFDNLKDGTESKQSTEALTHKVDLTAFIHLPMKRCTITQSRAIQLSSQILFPNMTSDNANSDGPTLI